MAAFFFADGPAGEMEKYVIETGLTDLYGSNAVWEVRHDARYELGAVLHRELYDAI